MNSSEESRNKKRINKSEEIKLGEGKNNSNLDFLDSLLDNLQSQTTIGNNLNSLIKSDENKVNMDKINELDDLLFDMDNIQFNDNQGERSKSRKKERKGSNNKNSLDGLLSEMKQEIQNIPKKRND